MDFRDAIKDEKIACISREEAEAKAEAAACNAREEAEKAKAEDTIPNLEELLSRLPPSILPANVEAIAQGNKVSFLKLNLLDKPSIEHSVAFEASSSCRIWLRGNEVSLGDILTHRYNEVDKKIT